MDLRRFTTRALLLLVGLCLLGHGLGALAERVDPPTDLVFREAERVRNRELGETLAGARAASIGNSHSYGLDFETLGLEGVHLGRAGGDLLESAYYLDVLRPRTEAVRVLFLSLSFFSLARDNAAWEGTRGRRLHLYINLPHWRWIDGDFGLWAMGRVDPLLPIHAVVRGDAWKGVLRGALAQDLAGAEADVESQAAAPLAPADERAPVEAGEAGADCPTMAPEALEAHAEEIADTHVGFSRSVLDAAPGTPERAESAARRLVGGLTERGVTVVLHTPPYHPGYSARFLARRPDLVERQRTFARELAEREDVWYVDGSQVPGLTRGPHALPQRRSPQPLRRARLRRVAARKPGGAGTRARGRGWCVRSKQHSVCLGPEGPSTMSGFLRLGIVGCGAVVEHFHLPATRLTPSVEATALVDRDADRACALADDFGVAHAFEDAAALTPDLVDGVLIATPPASHAPIALDLLARGLPVLCEKPLADDPADAARMVAAARDAGVMLATAHSRRFHDNLSTLKHLVDADAFGEVRHVRIRDGHPFGWPTRTGYMFSGATACGVLLENGIHALDSLLWLLGDEVEVEDYRDDARGGVESHVSLVLRFAHGARADVKVSRLAELANRLWLEGSLGRAELPLYDGRPLRLELPHGKLGSAAPHLDSVAALPQDNTYVMARQLADFASAARSANPPRASGEDGRRAVALAARCYTARPSTLAPDAVAEDDPLADDPAAALAGARVLVTGASGFIGGRAVERLHAAGAHVRALVRDPGRAVSLSRTTAELAVAELPEADGLDEAMAGMEVVLHCAAMLGGPREQMMAVNVEGTRAVVRAAAAAGARRVVCLSSLAVHGTPFPDGLDEDAPLAANTVYGESKRLAEETALEAGAASGVEVVLLRPTIVYGPGSQWWTIDPVRRLSEGGLVMAGPGDGAANVVHVDDVVDAMARASVVEGVAGRAYLINDEAPVTWARFFGAYARMLAVPLPRWPMPVARLVTRATDALDRGDRRRHGVARRGAGRTTASRRRAEGSALPRQAVVSDLPWRTAALPDASARMRRSSTRGAGLAPSPRARGGYAGHGGLAARPGLAAGGGTGWRLSRR